MKRLRLVKIVVKPMVMIDDGESLTEGEASQVVVPAADLDAFPGWLRDQLDRQQAALNGED